jgi:hypothetical protein
MPVVTRSRAKMMAENEERVKRVLCRCHRSYKNVHKHSAKHAHKEQVKESTTPIKYTRDVQLYPLARTDTDTLSPRLMVKVVHTTDATDGANDANDANDADDADDAHVFGTTGSMHPTLKHSTNNTPVLLVSLAVVLFLILN